MMGTSHAISGATAWVAVTATAVPALGLYPLTPSAVALGAVVCAGAALLPDADHHNATIAHSVPVAGQVAAGAIGKLTGGHRHGMHSLLAVALIPLATWGMSFVTWTFAWWHQPVQIGSAVVVAACTTFGVKVLKLARSWFKAWLFGFVLAAAVAFFAPSEFAWLPVCIGVGYAVHLLGDMLTIEGVPFLWPWNPKPPKSWRGKPITTFWHENGYITVPILGHAGSVREWLLTLPMTAYVLWGVGSSIVIAARPVLPG